jgi:hypothetical protein
MALKIMFALAKTNAIENSIADLIQVVAMMKIRKERRGRGNGGFGLRR